MCTCIYANGDEYNFSIAFRKETKNIALGNEQVNASMIYEREYKNNYFVLFYFDIFLFLMQMGTKM